MQQRFDAATTEAAPVVEAGVLRPLWMLLVVVALALVAYAPSTWNGYVFDDMLAIVDNPKLKAGDWWGAAYAHSSPLSNRPLSTLTLVLDAKLFSREVVGHHVANVLLHLAATALAFGCIRSTLRAARLSSHFDESRATVTAFVAAALWAVHPLGVDSVAYVTQRSTLCMAVFALAAFWATARAENSRHKTAWRSLAVVSVALAMVSKEDAVVLPLLLPLYVRAFLCQREGELRRFAPFLFAISSTWLVLGATVWFGPHNATVGYSTTPRCSAIEWLTTQATVVLHYLRLAVLPVGLRGCYGWPIVRELSPALLPGLGVVGLLIATAVACFRRPAVGFLGAWFFLWLAPTSSVLPIVTEIAAERRMYLPLLAVVVASALLFERLAGRLPLRRPRTLLLAPLLIALVGATWQRVAVYRDEASFWTDAYEKRDPECRTLIASMLVSNYARIVRERGDLEAAADLFEFAASSEEATRTVRINFAAILVEVGRIDRAREVLVGIAREAPYLANNLHAMARDQFERSQRSAPSGVPDPKDPVLLEAVVSAKMAAVLEPMSPAYQNTVGTLCSWAGQVECAEAAFRSAIQLDPDAVPNHWNLGQLLLGAGRVDEAGRVLRAVCMRRPGDAELRLQIAEALLPHGAFELAATLVDEALVLVPADARAEALRRVVAERRR